MNSVQDLLPIGSVVRLEGGQKNVVIIGVMQVKRQKDGRAVPYDYMGVPYPEGYVGGEMGLLFNHDKIREVIFEGYTNEERRLFIEAIQTIYEQTDKAVSQH